MFARRPVASMSSSAQHGYENSSAFGGITIEVSSDRERHDSETQLIQKIPSFSGSQHSNFQEIFSRHFEGEMNLGYDISNNGVPRHSITTVLSTPIVQLEGFLSDARSSVELSPDDLSQLGLSALDVHPQEDYPKSSFQSKIERLIQSFPLNLLTMLCILIDVGVVIADVTLYGFPSPEQLEHNEIPKNDVTQSGRDVCVAIDFSISVYLVAELLFCVVATGLRKFVTKWQNIIDALVTLVTFSFSLMDLIVEDTSVAETFVVKILRIARLCRLIRIVHVFRLYTMQVRLAKAARHLVSRNKRRYQHDGFDLDLTYVTDKVIAMSFPSTGQMSLYRNPITEVARFLDTKHPNSYKVYNLCDEHSYDSSYFHDRVEKYPFKDHNVPSVKQMIKFTASVRAWLEADPNNVIAVHCKGGKGRTGTMVCVWLVEAGIFLRAEDSLVYFGSRRTDITFARTFQGVETPSQCRYVEYYETIKEKGGVLPPETDLLPRKIRIEGISKIGKGDGSDFIVEFHSADRTSSLIYKTDLRNKHSNEFSYSYFPAERAVECTLTKCPLFRGDIQVVVKCHSRTAPKGCLGALFYFWFHCSFVRDYRLRLKRDQLDNPHKPSTWRFFDSDFAVQLDFKEPALHYLDACSDKYRTYAIRESFDLYCPDYFNP